MGMAASQARLLNLQARKSNLEYQGQQINQERTILSQQCTALYNSLLAMDVPTPPSTQDYTTVEYSGTDGATNFQIGVVKPSGELYNVEIQTTEAGDAIQSDYGSRVVKKPDETIHVEVVETGEDENNKRTFSLKELSNYYIKVSSNGDTETVEQIHGSNVQKYFKKDTNGKYTMQPADEGQTYTLYKPNASSTAEIENPNNNKVLIGGYVAYEFAEAKELFPGFSWSRYEEAINNSFDTEKDDITPEKFYVYIDISDTDVESVKFALKSDVGNANDIGDGFTETFSYTSNGIFTKSEQKDQCKLQFDAQGRITSIGIPQYNADGNEIIDYRNIELTAKTVTDNAAYQDAYNEYEYAQYEYDKKQQEINAKTEIIQQEDRNLELKLQRLDNERAMIEAETEAVDKVISDNIDGSFKTFSG